MAKWFYLVDGQSVGPIESAALKHLATSGRLKPTDKVRSEDLAEWYQAKQVKGLFVAQSDVAAARIAVSANPPTSSAGSTSSPPKAVLASNRNSPHIAATNPAASAAPVTTRPLEPGFQLSPRANKIFLGSFFVLGNAAALIGFFSESKSDFLPVIYCVLAFDTLAILSPLLARILGVVLQAKQPMESTLKNQDEDEYIASQRKLAQHSGVVDLRSDDDLRREFRATKPLQTVDEVAASEICQLLEILRSRTASESDRRKAGAKLVEIGKKLYAEGRIDKMLSVHSRVNALTGAGRFLECQWDGIGSWRA